jgi:hypothetical protein
MVEKTAVVVTTLTMLIEFPSKGLWEKQGMKKERGIYPHRCQ